MGAFM